MLSVDDIKAFFKVREDQELAPIFGRTPGAISTWRKSGVPASIERRAYEIMKERGIAPPDAAAAAAAPEELTQEMKEISDIFKNYPLAKAIMLKVSAMTEDEQFEYYKQMRDAEIEKSRGGKTAARED